MKRGATIALLVAGLGLGCDAPTPRPSHTLRFSSKPGGPIAVEITETACRGETHTFQARINPRVALADLQVAVACSDGAAILTRSASAGVETITCRAARGAYGRITVTASGRSEDGLPVARTAEVEINPENAPPASAEGRRTVDSQGRAVVEFEGETRSP